MNSSKYLSMIPKAFQALFAAAFTLILFGGCASTEMVEKNIIVHEKLSKPTTIYVYDFVANRADVPVDSVLSSMNSPQAPPQTAEEINVGNQLGSGIATDLVKKINDMGLNAAKGSSSTKPGLNDIVIRGYLVSVDEGDGAERVFIGFGYGKSELMTVIEGYQMTDKGLRKLGSGKIEALGGKMPGAGLGAASYLIFGNPIGLIVGLGVKSYGEISGSNKIDGLADSTASEIAYRLKLGFQKQGWIAK